MMAHVDQQLEREVFAANAYAEGSSRVFSFFRFFSSSLVLFIPRIRVCLYFSLERSIHHRQISAHERK
jgi:hypothetical protein